MFDGTWINVLDPEEPGGRLVDDVLISRCLETETSISMENFPFVRL